MQFKNIFILRLLKKYKPSLIVIFEGHGAKETKDLINYTLSGFTRTFHSESPKIFYELHKYLGGFWGVLRCFIFLKPLPKLFIILDSPGGINYKLLKNILKLDTVVIMPKEDILLEPILFSSSYNSLKDAISEAKTANFVVFNTDDEAARDLVEALNVKQASYGFDAQADISVAEANNQLSFNGSPHGGINIKIDYDANFIPVNVKNIFGKRSVYAICSALAVAMHYGINFVDASTRISQYKASFNFLELVGGIKNTALLVHIRHVTANSALESLKISVQLKEANAGKRLIVVLGDIFLSNLQTEETLHRNLGEIIASSAEHLFLDGEKTVFTEEEAKNFEMSEHKIHSFTSIQAMNKKIKEVLVEGDIILILGSNETHMRKVVSSLKK